MGAWVTGAGDWKWPVGVASVPVWVFCLGVLSGRSVWALSGRCLGVVLDVVRECALSGHGGAGGLSLVQE